MRHNYSDEVRKRIARELARLTEELDALERELRKLWIEQRMTELGEEFGEESNGT